MQGSAQEKKKNVFQPKKCSIFRKSYRRRLPRPLTVSPNISSQTYETEEVYAKHGTCVIFSQKDAEILKNVGWDSLHSRSQDPPARDTVFRKYLPWVRSCGSWVQTSIKRIWVASRSLRAYTHVLRTVCPILRSLGVHKLTSTSHPAACISHVDSAKCPTH